MSVVCVAVVLYLVALPIGAGGVVHKHHKVVLQVYAYVLVVETFGRIFLWLLAVLAIGVFGGPLKFCGGHTIYLYKHFIYHLQLFFFHGKQLLLLGSIVGCIAQAQAKLAQFPLEQGIEGVGVVAGVCFGHNSLGYNSIFSNKVGYTGVCATIAQRVFEEPIHNTVLFGLFACVYDTLQKEVRFFELVEEKVIYLRELECSKVLLGNHFGTHHVHTGEQPATAR